MPMKKPTEKEIHEAVRKLLLWAGDDPDLSLIHI